MKELLVEAILQQQYYIDVDAFNWGFNETTNMLPVHLLKSLSLESWAGARVRKKKKKKNNN